MCVCVCQVKPPFLNRALYNADCVKAAVQCQQENSLSIMQDENDRESFSSYINK